MMDLKSPRGSVTSSPKESPDIAPLTVMMPNPASNQCVSPFSHHLMTTLQSSHASAVGTKHEASTPRNCGSGKSRTLCSRSTKRHSLQQPGFSLFAALSPGAAAPLSIAAEVPSPTSGKRSSEASSAARNCWATRSWPLPSSVLVAGRVLCMASLALSAECCSAAGMTSAGLDRKRRTSCCAVPGAGADGIHPSLTNVPGLR